MKTGTRSGCLLLLCLLTVSESSSLKIVYAGQNVTLPCKYNVKTHGSVAVCWGRGEIPNSGCNDQIIATDGSKVTEETRRSSRFQLLGRLRDGDVSLTILNATPRDSGRYGCRVQVPGWFNDLRYHRDLTVETAPEPTSSRASDHVTSTEQTPSNHTQGHMNSTEYWVTSRPHGSQAEEEESSNSLVFVVCALFVLAAVATVVGVVIIARRWRRLNKLLHIPQGSSSSVRFSSSGSSLRLHSRGSAVENIYQIEEINDYETVPGPSLSSAHTA
ncbi:hepatitis A virus cellular receptor 1 [Centroberyx affinis]|uniref:hepatitis A virus cellular receptor 1 n=1 Tax=Centroberyx affinis TaxID=166261 RepID=UPI003A5BF3EA